MERSESSEGLEAPDSIHLVARPNAKRRRGSPTPAAGPGPVRAKTLPLIELHPTHLVRCSDYRIRELFERADVMSEGDVDGDEKSPTYFGTTSVLLPSVRSGGSIVESERALAYRYLSVDPHARIRAIRIACREAQVRCRAPIRHVRADVSIRNTPDGVRFDVEVEAPLHASGAHAGKSRPRRR